MIEFLKNLFGLCGESHINIFTLLVISPLIIYLTYKIIRYVR